MADLRAVLKHNHTRLSELDGREGALTAELVAVLGALAADVDVSVQRHDAAARTAAAAFDQQRADLERNRDKQGKVRATRLANEVKAGSIALRDAAASFAGRRPAAPSDRLRAEDLCPSLAVRDIVSVGTLRLPAASQVDRQLPEVPALLSLLNRGHVVIEAERSTAGFGDIVTSLVAQTYLSAPAGQVVVTVFNPRLSTHLSGFQSAGAADNGILVNLPPTEAAFQASLEEHLAHIVNVDQSMAGQYPDMGSLVVATGQHEHQYRCLVVLDAPAQWSTTTHDALERILHEGAARGVSVILHVDPSAPAPGDLPFARLRQGQPVLRPDRPGRWSLAVPGARGAAVVTTPPPVPLTAQQRVMALVVEAAKVGSLPNVPFAEMVAGAPVGSSIDGVRCILGRNGTQTVDLVLGDTASNLHNVLVGGAVGTGKTNLLMVLIYSLAAQYGPDELRFFLLDFKEGVEFQRFAGDRRAALPHASVVSMESDVQFGLATLQHFVSEIERRSSLFKAEGAKDLAGFRRTTGRVLPRWILVVDEFQVLFEGETNETATALLETVVRKGRAFGLHVILASQTLSGIRFAGGKDEAIFAQFPVRLVLKLPKPDSQIFLGLGNDAAARLRYRGQAVLNKAYGLQEENKSLVVAYADHDYLDELQEGLAGRHPRTDELRVYRGNAPAQLHEMLQVSRPTGDDDVSQMWLGQECTVAAAPATAMLEVGTGNNLMVLGNDVLGAVATVQTASLSVLSSLATGAQVLVLNGLPARFRAGAGMEPWQQALVRLGAEVRTFGGDETEDYISAVADAARAGRRTLAALLGAEYTDFQQRAYDEDWGDDLQNFNRSGVHVLGHWTDLRSTPVPAQDPKIDHHTLVFVGAARQVVEDATGLLPSDVPACGAGRALLFHARDGRAGLRTIAALRPLEHEDFAAW
ncbi:FtsK/SpoIIIE domain-containing protein [Modestobacter sp. VKM Ac-2984]|uniref:FtsK/SpoIIIE domain-containing protein n=1 Tax=Modestobacter sp. VKM Ac-2984 TaxID=3004138 RepID=UPI0022AB2C35|nr:FtsK/SpoIIIE domain-containing protein [Modestobacter sp. VKM Ac-2984]MCZ2817274.1 FtsK/SpoIIIE domain-containing protein [Modestobacter sp. VKM Ac-2984]